MSEKCSLFAFRALLSFDLRTFTLSGRMAQRRAAVASRGSASRVVHACPG
jgi:hypothetical protein